MLTSFYGVLVWLVAEQFEEVRFLSPRSQRSQGKRVPLCVVRHQVGGGGRVFRGAAVTHSVAWALCTGQPTPAGAWVQGAPPGRGVGSGGLTLYLVPRFKQMCLARWVKQKAISSWLLTWSSMYWLTFKEMDWSGGAWTCRLRSHQFQAFWGLPSGK